MTESRAEGDAPDALGARVVAPSGESFEPRGPAGPVRLSKAPRIPAQAGQELLVVKEGALFVCSGRDGDIEPLNLGEGLYRSDTRHLSELRLTIGGARPVLLSSSAGRAYEASVDLTNPALGEGDQIAQMTLYIRRRRLVASSVYERLELHNHGHKRAATEVALRLGADFADMFEVRRVSRRRRRGEAFAPKLSPTAVVFAYRGQDGAFRQTRVAIDPPAAVTESDGRVELCWEIDLEPGGAVEIELAITPAEAEPAPPPSGFGTARAEVIRSHEGWRASCARVAILHARPTGVLDASARDLRALLTPVEDGEVIAAGIPWYVAAFGRDALITALESMMLTPQLARSSLLFLAKRQARADDPLRDAEPGKILHELRLGELAGAGLIPHTPYYGSVDSTPLFLLAAASYHRWTADLETLEALRPALDAALAWIDQHGDADGDGFVEYAKRSPAGLDNQGWKDSDDSVVHPDGSLAEPPIALVEVQAYVYLAKLRIADVYDALGEDDLARSLRAEAARLRVAFDQAFWMEEEQTYALALDRDKRQVRSVASNAGHALYCDIADPERATKVVARLMAEDMFSGWGIRTLSAEHRAYNPMSYHNGSVWPHDNAIIAAGFKRYGYARETELIADALFDAAMLAADMRLPELYCGFERRPDLPFVAYPVACRPQAWAAAAPFMVLQALLGISANAPEGVLTVHRPHLPAWMERLEIRGLAVGPSRVDLSFVRAGDATSFALLGRVGPIRVALQG